MISSIIIGRKSFSSFFFLKNEDYKIDLFHETEQRRSMSSKTLAAENAVTQLIQLNCLLAESTRALHYSKTLKLFQQIHSSHHLKPDQYSLSTTLSACANHRNTLVGTQLHVHSIKSGLKRYPHVSNALLSLYAKSEYLGSVKRVFGEIKTPDVYSWTTLLSACSKLGEVEYACKVFDRMSLTDEVSDGKPERNAAVWNAVITGCAENGYKDIAFGLFKRMQMLGVRHDNYTFASVLSLCCRGIEEFARAVHSLVIKTGYLVKPSVVTALLTMYFDIGSVEDAYKVFEVGEGEGCDCISYNAMIAGLASAGRDVEALCIFKDMQEVQLRPTELTFVSVLGLCSCARIAIQVHAQIMKIGYENCTSVRNAAMTMYSTCGDLDTAHTIFQEMQEKDTISWNAIITGYAQRNLAGAAILAYQQMQSEGIRPDEFTVGSLLASTEMLFSVEMILAIVFKYGLFSNTQVSNALLSAFSRYGEIKQARVVFNGMGHRNLISWNSLISALQLNGFLLEGLEEFSELLKSEMSPNAYSFSIALSICANISALGHGKQIHGYILKNGYFQQTSLGNALITLYAKSGDLDRSVKVFNAMNEKDIISWNSMISAYAQHGEGRDAARCFQVMQDSAGIKPDKATFTAVLSACSHTGLVDNGIHIFNSMVNKYGLEPGVDHFSCIVDLLGRAGHLDVAERLITTKLIDIDSNIWWTLFSSCAAHGNLRLGRIIAECLLKKEHKNSTVFVLLSNIYADASQWEEAANMRELMKTCGKIKQPGCSWIRS
ncbi:pentatricopeptide repeat-containing protein At3g49740 [Daucus carota subsp. sativus]|nr:PREDICTED: pentatricopeptide repeat-containing protein At3g49740 [Daucus carota subsp. sativus]